MVVDAILHFSVYLSISSKILHTGPLFPCMSTFKKEGLSHALVEMTSSQVYDSDLSLVLLSDWRRVSCSGVTQRKRPLLGPSGAAAAGHRSPLASVPGLPHPTGRAAGGPNRCINAPIRFRGQRSSEATVTF